MIRRYDWIDCLKGFGAILVIFGHLNPAMPIECYIYSFHMPLFFFISGILKKNKEQPLISFVKKKAKTLLAPLIIWNIISTAILMVIGYNKHQLLYGTFFINKELPANTPIWFLLNLFICEVLYEFLLSNKIPNIAIIVVSAIIGFFTCEQTILPFTLYTTPISLCFYTLGSTLRPKMLQNKLTNVEKCAIPILLAISILYGALLNERISMANGYYDNKLYFFIAAISGVIVWTLIFRILPASKMLIKIGKQSLFLMCSQYMIFIIARKISIKIFQYDIWLSVSTIKATITTIVLLLISFTFIFILNHLGKKYLWISRFSSLLGIQEM